MSPRTMSTLRTATTALALALTASRAAAQQEEVIPFHVVGFTAGATTMSVDALNGQLTPAGFAGLSNDGISYGVTGRYAFGRALLGLEAARTAYGEEGLSNGRSDDLSAVQLLATAGYALIAMPRFMAAPILGIGVGQFDVTLRDRNSTARASNAQPTFAEIAQNPGSSSTISGSHLLFSVGGAGDFLVTRGSKSNAGVIFGIRAGYLLAPNRTRWSSNGRDVIAGPDASAAGPFLRVVIGIGGH